MNKDTAKDYLPLVQALADGEVIQYRFQKSDKSYGWMDLESSIDFCMPADCYRIKPEPREIWVNHYSHSDYVYKSEAEAKNFASHEAATRRYREVLE